ncbi:MAG: response regulator [Chloroflexi bacterium]|nr:response regulator [Chloroflexota bacterium]MBU1751709.1 response regulator [Chloroflexota bacterium]
MATNPVVLLVEDDPVFQTVIQQALSRSGYTIYLTTTGQEMIERLTTARTLPALIVLDWYLPRNEIGAAPLTWLRSNSNPRLQTLPVLVLTAGRNPERIRQQALDAGASECLPKTSPVSLMVECIHRLIASNGPVTSQLQLFGRRVLRPDQGRQIFLPPKQAELLRVLLENHDQQATYAVLESRLFPLGSNRRQLLRRRVHSLNGRLAILGVQVRASRQYGMYYLHYSQPDD